MESGVSATAEQMPRLHSDRELRLGMALSRLKLVQLAERVSGIRRLLSPGVRGVAAPNSSRGQSQP
jgi:hypothetical protein